MVDGPEPGVVRHGDVSAADADYAAEKVKALYRFAPKPVLHSTIRLTHEPNPAHDRPCAVEASLDVSGRHVRSHVAAAGMSEAIDLASAKLQRRLEDLAERSLAVGRRPKRERRPEPHEWRHADPTEPRPHYFPRVPEEREVMRRKAFAMHPMRPDEAAFDLDLLDHEFYLFTNVDTDEENLISRGDDGTYVLTQQRACDTTLADSAVPIVVSDVHPPVTDEAAALALLDESGTPFVFFVDADIGRGRVAYRRYDGHYGVIGPSP